MATLQDNIPEELRSRPQWVSHRRVPGKNGKTQNVPFVTTGLRHASPQGAASLSLAVLENDGRKREVVTDRWASWGGQTAVENYGQRR